MCVCVCDDSVSRSGQGSLYVIIVYLSQCKGQCVCDTMYLGQCKRSGCHRLRVFSPRTGQLQEYCSIKCKNLDIRPGTFGLVLLNTYITSNSNLIPNPSQTYVWLLCIKRSGVRHSKLVLHCRVLPPGRNSGYRLYRVAQKKVNHRCSL